ARRRSRAPIFTQQSQRSLSLYTLCALLRFHSFFFFNDPATTEIYTLSLHDALPIWHRQTVAGWPMRPVSQAGSKSTCGHPLRRRSEEHTSELQSLTNLVCRLLLEKKKKGHRTQEHTSKIQTRTNLEGRMRLVKRQLMIVTVE